MISTIAKVNLPVDEVYMIQKNRIKPDKLSGNEKRISIVTGIHGDELEGQYVCYEINRIMRENMDKLHGIVDIYPALNPLGIDSVTRGIPMFDLDMNRIFPGSENGNSMEYIAAKITDDLKGSDMCIDIHASNIFLREMPQVRISEDMADELTPYAKLLNVDFVWIYPSATVLESTLAYSMNTLGVPTLVAEMGVGMRITKEYTNQLVTGILNLMKQLGIWAGEVENVRQPFVSKDQKVKFVNADASGIFVPNINIWDDVKKGDFIGEILNPLSGAVEQLMVAPIDGKVFTLREYPIVYHGSLIARITGGIHQ